MASSFATPTSAQSSRKRQSESKSLPSATSKSAPSRQPPAKKAKKEDPRRYKADEAQICSRRRVIVKKAAVAYYYRKRWAKPRLSRPRSLIPKKLSNSEKKENRLRCLLRKDNLYSEKG